ncbi:hypothetical protein FHS02_005347 [Massilia umbonata]|uniref:Uncharacterized protein n=1 Tax=Pseudoduganella umbonata TaxID=864828 RepID=A0A7W5EGS5_9BURK|nr:hypothetical protein [Pseudoduganella umbonata]
MHSSKLRRRYIAVTPFAILHVWLQIFLDGSPLLSAGVTLVQLAGVFFGGMPGSLNWLIFSREPRLIPNRRSWDNAMHWFIIISMGAWALLGNSLSEEFLPLSSSFLFFIYATAKFGCSYVGCCGWNENVGSQRILRELTSLQIIESSLAFVAGIIVILWVLICGAEENPIRFYLAAICVHMFMREIFTSERMRD